MPDDRISLRQLLTLTFAALLSPAIQLLPGSTARRAGEAGWLATLVALPVLLGLCWLLWRLFRGGLPNTAQQLLGPALGRVFCLLYFLWIEAQHGHPYEILSLRPQCGRRRACGSIGADWL